MATLLTIVISSFASWYYLGRGASLPITLYFKSDPAKTFGPRVGAFLLHATDDGFYLVPSR